jgi:hypothetical protein
MGMILLTAAWRDRVRTGRQVRTNYEPRRPHGARVLSTLAQPVLADPREARLDSAHSMVVVHVPGADGWCVGCADLGRYALAPCPAARQALSLVETHGVAVWDARPSACVDGERGGASLTPLDAGGASPLSRVAV